MNIVHTRSTFSKLSGIVVMVAMLLLSFADPASAQLSGTYTINPTGGNYTSIGAAVSALTASGVSGPVTFNIAPATYTEQVTIPAITGASSTNTITFNGTNVSTCIVEYNTASSYTSVIKLDGADYIRIRNLTINATGTTYGYGIHLLNQADYNEITGCVITVNTTSTNTICMGIAAAGASSTSTGGNYANYTLVEDNIVRGGYYAIRFNGTSSTTQCTGNQVIDNTVEDYYYYGIYFSYQAGLVASGNNVADRGQTTSAYGIYANYAMGGPVVTSNYIKAGTYGIRIGYANVDSTVRGRVANNMVVCSGTSTNYGVYVYYSYMMDVWYNTFNLLSATGTCYGLYSSNSTSNPNMHHDFRNNIVKQNGTGTFYPVYSSELSAISHIAHDYNVYYAVNGVYSFRVDAANTYATLADAKLALPAYFQHCMVLDPMFTSDTDLHVAEPGLNAAAQAIPAITVDFDVQTRHATTPDIGADEFFPPTDDVGVSSIDSPLNFCAGLNPVTVTIYNYGVNQITSATINWTLNGAPQTPFPWTGTLGTSSPAARAAQVTIGTSTFVAGVPYTIVVWTSNPNGVPDTQTSNDTVTVVRKASLSGNYTIGGASPDYTTFSAAIADIAADGVCGPVLFTVRPGTYTGQIDIPEIPGASSTNTITFDGTNAATTTLEFNTATSYSYVLCLDGADYVRIRNFTINATGGTYGTGILLTNVADYNEITDCNINVNATGTSNYAVGIAASTKTSLTGSGNHANYNLIEGCTIRGGYYNVSFYGPGSTNPSLGNRFIDNELLDWYYAGLRLYYVGNYEAIGNTITPRSAPNSTTYALYSYYAREGLKIIGNEIFTGNYGIYVYYANRDSTVRGTIANNMVVCTGDGTNAGVYAPSGHMLDVWYNSINLMTQTGTGYGMYLTGTVNTGHDVRNNTVKYNNGTGTFYVFYVSDITPIGFTALDYNNGYRAIGTVQYYSNSTYYDRAALLLQYPGYNANTMEIDPGYFSDTDLHTAALTMNGTAQPITAITTDIDGDTRHLTTPDIGADEFSPPDFEIAVEAINIPSNTCGLSSAETITVTLRNLGGLTLNTSVNPVPVTLQITGPITQTINGTMNSGTIASGMTAVFTVSTNVNFSIPGLYTITATATLAGDANLSNNVLGPVSMRADELIATFPYNLDFEANDGAWTPTLLGNSVINDWEWGVPNYSGTGTINTAHSGQKVWATKLTGMYSQNSEAALVSPCFNFTGMTAPKLVFWMNYYSEYEWDGLIVEGSSDGGANWSKLTPLSPAYTCLTSQSVFPAPFYSTEGADNSWKKYVFDLSQYGNQSNIKIRFHYFSDEFVTAAGWAIDDIAVGAFSESDIAVTHVRYNNTANLWARVIGLPHVIEATVENRGYQNNPASILFVYKPNTNPADPTDGVAETLSPAWSGTTGTVTFTVPHVPAATGILPFFVRAFHLNDAYAGNDYAMTTPNIQDDRTVGYEDFELLSPPNWEKFWTVQNINGGETWTMMAGTGVGGSNAATYPGDVTTADDWLISPITELKPGSSYSLAFKYRSRNGSAQTLEVAYGTSPNPTSMTVFATFSGFTNTAFIDAIGSEGVAPYFNTSTMPEMYYIGIHVASNANAGEVDIDFIKFAENPTPPPKISYGENGVFITDPLIPITFSGVYKKTGLLSKTFTVTNATGKYGSPVGDMLWNVTGSADWFTITKPAPDPLTWLTTNPYNPPWLRQDQTFTIEVNASTLNPGTYTSSISIDAKLYNDDFPNGIRASNALFTVPVIMTVIETGGEDEDQSVVRTGNNLTAAGNPWIFTDAYSNTIATVWVTQGTIPAFTITSYPAQLPRHLSRFRYAKHYWTIEATGTGWLADVQFHYFDSELTAGFVTREDLLTGMRLAPNTSFWENPIAGTSSVANPSGNFVTVAGISPANHAGSIALAHSWLIPLKQGNGNAPAAFALEQNYPNPFNPATTLSFSIAEDAFVTLSVTNALGEEVARLVNESIDAGSYSVKFDASHLPSGMYMYTLRAGTFTQTRTMILNK